MHASFVGWFKRSIRRFENDDPERVFGPVVKALLLREKIFHPRGLVSGDIKVTPSSGCCISYTRIRNVSARTYALNILSFLN